MLPESSVSLIEKPLLYAHTLTTWMRAMTIIRGTLILLIFILAGCAPKKPVTELSTGEMPKSLEAQKSQKSAESVTSWNLNGAIAARNSKKAWTASVNWVQQGPNQYNIRLFGPLGGGTVLIQRNGNTITYQDGPKKITSDNADALLQQQTGVRLPVSHLYYWVRGLPASGAIQSVKRDPNGRLIAMQQAGYSINYDGYILTAQGVALPSKIRLQGNGVLIKLIIKHWS